MRTTAPDATARYMLHAMTSVPNATAPASQTAACCALRGSSMTPALPANGNTISSNNSALSVIYTTAENFATSRKDTIVRDLGFREPSTREQALLDERDGRLRKLDHLPGDRTEQLLGRSHPARPHDDPVAAMLLGVRHDHQPDIAADNLGGVSN